jgi:ketosteroid isomerase-like protein
MIRRAGGPPANTCQFRKSEDMAHESITDEELAALIQSTAEAASAYMRGDIRRYLALIKPAEDHTLMAPAGGELIRGRDDSDEAIEITSRYFQAGDADLEVVQTYTSCDLVVMTAIERQHGEVGGLPDQDWSLRVTLVFRREGSEWRQVHRHADPLVHGISLEQAAGIARGEASDTQ